ncbi:serine carboxypeptidase-like 46 isoform X2 [Quercus suber]|uniref:serine carboxypeptidase-like 46 isoform X2 n=1 Tax=Quercus suber TaxID=58331 RepID=UPI000D2C2222|nr:serine carboxypeptidase-like 42 [Quercus suber]
MAFWIFVLIFSFYSKSSAEVITALPGQPTNVSFRQFSGYITTDARHGRALFYYFVEAKSAKPLSRPLTLWLNGGPGCSSLGYGAFMEHGPFQPGDNGLLVKNGYSWNLGHYIPQLAALLMEYNKNPNIKPIKLRAIALGNPLLDLDISVQAGDYLWSHGAISDEILMLKKTVCNDSKYLHEYVHGKLSQGCKDVFNRASDEISTDVAYDGLLLPNCLSSSSAEQFRPKGKHGKIHAMVASRGTRGDPCLVGRVLTYLNKPQVQKAMHANTTHLPFSWNFCLGPLEYQEDNLDMNLIPLISDLIRAGIPIMLYSGDQDSKIPLTQTRIIANKLAKDLKLSPFTKYGTWYDKKQVGGWSQSFGGLKDRRNVTFLTYATVRGAAHEVPFTSPSQALKLFRSFLSGTPLPRSSA